MPHIQNQNTSDRMINTEFSVKRRASSMGVSAFTLHEVNTEVEDWRQQCPP